MLSRMPSFILNSREVVGEFLKFYFCFKELLVTDSSIVQEYSTVVGQWLQLQRTWVELCAAVSNPGLVFSL